MDTPSEPAQPPVSTTSIPQVTIRSKYSKRLLFISIFLIVLLAAGIVTFPAFILKMLHSTTPIVQVSFATVSASTTVPDIKILPTTISNNGPIPIDISQSNEPEDFDSSYLKQFSDLDQAVNVSTSTVKLNGPFSLSFYLFNSDAGYDSVIGISKDGTRQALYSYLFGAFNPQLILSQDNNYLFLSQAIKNPAGTWNLVRHIVNIAKNTSTTLPNIDCVSDHGFWNDNKLITYESTGKNGFDANSFDNTHICIWDTQGNLTTRLEASLLWEAAAGPDLNAQFGLLPRDSNIFYSYNYVDPAFRKSGATFPQKSCYVSLQDLTNQKRNKQIKLMDVDSDGACPEVTLDLTNVTFNSKSIPYTLVVKK